jgi:hypothetical protein
LMQSLRLPYSAAQLLGYVRKRFPEQRVAFVYEAGPTGFGLYDELVAGGIPRPSSGVKADAVWKAISIARWKLGSRIAVQNTPPGSRASQRDLSRYGNRKGTTSVDGTNARIHVGCPSHLNAESYLVHWRGGPLREMPYPSWSRPDPSLRCMTWLCCGN